MDKKNNIRETILRKDYVVRFRKVYKFRNILSSLHFSNNEVFSTDKLIKLCPTFDFIIEIFQTIYRPGQNISIDKSLLPMEGSSFIQQFHFKQFNCNKRAHFGIKLFECCESKISYVYNAVTYVGKDKKKISVNQSTYRLQ